MQILKLHISVVGSNLVILAKISYVNDFGKHAYICMHTIMTSKGQTK